MCYYGEVSKKQASLSERKYYTYQARADIAHGFWSSPEIIRVHTCYILISVLQSPATSLAGIFVFIECLVFVR
jgi:hypothetical protein